MACGGHECPRNVPARPNIDQRHITKRDAIPATKSHARVEESCQNLQSKSRAGAQWFWRVTQFRQRERHRTLHVVCVVAGSPNLRCLSGGPEFSRSCLEVLRLIRLETVRKALAACSGGIRVIISCKSSRNFSNVGSASGDSCSSSMFSPARRSSESPQWSSAAVCAANNRAMRSASA